MGRMYAKDRKLAPVEGEVKPLSKKEFELLWKKVGRKYQEQIESLEYQALQDSKTWGVIMPETQIKLDNSRHESWQTQNSTNV